MTRIFCCVCCVFIYFFISASDVPASSLLEEAQKHYLKGKEYYRNKEFSRADQEFKKAEELLKAYSSSHKETSPSPGPLPSPQKKLSSEPRKVVYDAKTEEVMRIIKKADEAFSSGRYDEAIKLYTEAGQIMPHNPDIFFNLGVLYLKVNSYWEASQAFERVIELNPQDSSALYNLGILYEVFLNEPSRAVSFYKKYLELSPDAPDRRMVEAWISVIEKENK